MSTYKMMNDSIVRVIYFYHIKDLIIAAYRVYGMMHLDRPTFLDLSYQRLFICTSIKFGIGMLL